MEKIKYFFRNYLRDDGRRSSFGHFAVVFEYVKRNRPPELKWKEIRPVNPGYDPDSFLIIYSRVVI